MSSSRFNKNGPNFVPAYQISGVPYVTSSAGSHGEAPVTHIKFPNVTKSLMIANTSNFGLRVAFTKSGSYGPGEKQENGETTAASHQANYFLILPGEGDAGEQKSKPTVFDVRCTEVFLRSNSASSPAGFSLFAALTGIEKDHFPTITGSNEFEGVG